MPFLSARPPRFSWLPVALLTGLALAGSAAAVTVEVRIAGSSDDAEQRDDGSVTVTSSDLELVEDGSDLQVVGLRFPGVVIPPGATIEQAWVQFETDEVQTGAAALTLEGETTPQAPAFQALTNNVSTRPRTTASLPWAPAPWTLVGEQGLNQRTSSLVSVIQELVDAPAWAGGDAVVLIVTGSGRRTARSFDGGAAGAPLLHVEYTGSGNGLPEITLATPYDGATYEQGTTIPFSGSASDPEDGDLTPSMSWLSNLDGVLGVGAGFSRADLSLGVHSLTVSVMDSFGQPAQLTRQLTVFAPTNQLLAAGNVGYCLDSDDEATGELLESLPGRVLALGDLAYPDASSADFAGCFDPAWGKHKARMDPIAGNHEWHQPLAAPYFDYFGAAAGTPGEGWYSFDLGSWHIIGVHSDCNEFEGGCGLSTPQGLWLQNDLATSSKPCTLVFSHIPRFSSIFGVEPDQLDFWQLFYDHGVDVILTAHAHNYERFARQNPGGGADPTRGLRQFVIGTGGRSLSDPIVVLPNSEVRQADTFGVLGLALGATSYAWQFHGAGPGSFTDSGSEECIYGAPEVTIASPTPGQSFASGASVSLAASATDLEQGLLSSQLAWSSSRDGALGTGAALSVVLSAGTHVLTAAVTDETGLAGSAQVSVTVAVPPGSGCGSGPELLPALALLLLWRRTHASPARSEPQASEVSQAQ